MDFGWSNSWGRGGGEEGGGKEGRKKEINLDEVEVIIKNVQQEEEESSSNMHRIHLLDGGDNGQNPFDPIDVGLDEMMQSHPKIIETVIIRRPTTKSHQHTHRKHNYHIQLYIHANNYHNYHNP